MSWLGLRAKLVLASTFGCAWAVAHCGGQLAIIPEGQERETLRALPIAGLRVEEEVSEGLAEVGVTTIGELLDLPRSALPSRFGEQLLFRLDQALGSAIEIIEPVRPRPPVRAEIEFNGPTTQYEAIEMAKPQGARQAVL
jgi:protein ImuB